MTPKDRSLKLLALLVADFVSSQFGSITEGGPSAWADLQGALH